MSSMAKVVADMTMSLDGFIADEHDGVEDLFGWYGNGDVTVPTADPRWTFQVSEASARHLRPAFDGSVGALVCGRRIFDHTQGWGVLREPRHRADPAERPDRRRGPRGHPPDLPGHRSVTGDR
jgi:hypothetical protein